MTTEELFFEALKRHRKSKNIEISEICEFTKIDPKYINAIENGEFNILPTVYMRLFLRAYADFIDSNSAKVLEDFELYTTGKVSQKIDLNTKSETNKTPSNIINEINSSTKIAPKQIIIATLAVISLFLLLYWAGEITNEQKDAIEDAQEITIEAIDSTQSSKDSQNILNSENNNYKKKNQ